MFLDRVGVKTGKGIVLLVFIDGRVLEDHEGRREQRTQTSPSRVGESRGREEGSVVVRTSTLDFTGVSVLKRTSNKVLPRDFSRRSGNGEGGDWSCDVHEPFRSLTSLSTPSRPSLKGLR